MEANVSASDAIATTMDGLHIAFVARVVKLRRRTADLRELHRLITYSLLRKTVLWNLVEVGGNRGTAEKDEGVQPLSL